LATDKVNALAKKRGVPVVAWLPDEFAIDPYDHPGQIPTVEEFERHIANGVILREMTATGWLLIRPAQPAVSRSSRMDRSALANVVTHAIDKGVPALDDVAKYAVTSPFPMLAPAASPYFDLFVPSEFDSQDEATAWEASRFFGMLDFEQLRQLRTGSRLAFGGISGSLLQQLRHIIFGADQALHVDHPSTSKNPILAVNESSEQESEDYRTEPTELLLAGLPEDGYVEMRLGSEPFLIPSRAGGQASGVASKIISVEDIAVKSLYDKNRPASTPLISGRVQAGERITYELRFVLAPGVSIRTVIMDYKFDPRSSSFSAQNPPDSWKQALAATMDELSKSPFGAALLRPRTPHAVHP
jgi:hypothetical protein